jgi:ribosomal protein S12 methylthiotransferase
MDTTYSSERRQTKGTYAFVSLGCPKNLVDSERMLGLLQLDGYQLVNEPAGTDFVIVNTCGFIEEARQESYQTIDEMLALKNRGSTRGVIVAGCLAERQREQMLKDRPQIDSLVGVFGREQVTQVADRLLGDLAEQRNVFQPAPIRALSDHDRLRITPPHVAYLKISEGCDRLCTFCAIPQMRGKHASKPIETIVSEARDLVSSGTRELILVAQDTTYYGIDLYGRTRLAELLEQLNRIDGLDWIRLMYFYPMYIDNRLIETIAAADKILPYIDMPLQHINDTMLRRMSRRVTRDETEALIEELRSGIPNLTLRTTFITGFPGETDSAFEELADFVRQQRFQRLGVFTYSHEESTPSAQLKDHLPEHVKQQRRDALMQIQQQVAYDWAAAQIGSRQDVILDRRLEDEENVWVGRTVADAPDVDAVALVSEDQQALRAGALVECEVVTHHDYDLVAIATGPPR